MENFSERRCSALACVRTQLMRLKLKVGLLDVLFFFSSRSSLINVIPRLLSRVIGTPRWLQM